MKVKCITDEHNYCTKGKIYEVFLDSEIHQCIIDDTGDEYVISGDIDIFEVVQGDNLGSNKSDPLQKTLRDEFAMAAINAMGHKYDFRKMVEYTSIAEVAYEMANAMLKVREENANTNE